MSENFKQIQQQLAAALNEPRAPQRLIEQTRRRCEAVVWGRQAEQRLAQQGAPLSQEEIGKLAAISTLGQLALTKRLPDGMSLSHLAQQIADEPCFQRQLGGTAHDTLRSLRSGALMRQTAQTRAAHRIDGGTRDKQGPVR